MRIPPAYFADLDALLRAMPPGQLDTRLIDANEQRHRHRFFDPPETVYQWLLDRQRRVQAAAVHPSPLAPRSSWSGSSR
jgi:hypothetical protein